MRRYGVWAGNEKGTPEDPTRCVVEIFPKDGYIPCQCRNRRHKGPDGLYCGIHANAIAAGKTVLVPSDEGPQK